MDDVQKEELKTFGYGLMFGLIFFFILNDYLTPDVGRYLKTKDGIIDTTNGDYWTNKWDNQKEMYFWKPQEQQLKDLKTDIK